jgi:hypothetical protein
MSLVTELVLQASSQLRKSPVTKGPNIELNPLNHTRRNSAECWKKEKKCKMSLVLELVIQASSQLWNTLVTEGFNTELNPLSRTRRDSPKCRENEKIMQNEPSVGARASCIQPTLEPPRYSLSSIH